MRYVGSIAGACWVSNRMCSFCVSARMAACEPTVSAIFKDEQMRITIIDMIAIGFYLSAAIWQGIALSGSLRYRKRILVFLGLFAVVFHAVLLHRWIDTVSGQNLAFLNMLSLVVWLVVVLVLVSSLRRPVDNLLLLVFPIATLSILLVHAFPRYSVINTRGDPRTLFHIFLGVLTFGTLCMAALQAGVLAFQERLLRDKPVSTLVQFLPPLETMESLLFQMVWLGFVLLSSLLVTSISFFFDAMITRYLLQKSILVVLAWCIFAILLVGRYRFGWRGRKAIYYTLSGVLLLIPVYFGSQWLLGILL